MPNDSTAPTSPTTPTVVVKKPGFAWSTFIAGCLVGGCLVPLVMIVIMGIAGASTIPLIMKEVSKNPELLKSVSSLYPSTTSSPTTSSLPPTALQCGTDSECMQNAIATCTPAISTIDSPQFSMAFKVLGPSKKTVGNCQVSFEIANVTEPSLQMLGLAGQNMVCDVKPSALENTSDILNAPDSDLNCDGTLWGLLKIVRAGQGTK